MVPRNLRDNQSARRSDPCRPKPLGSSQNVLQFHLKGHMMLLRRERAGSRGEDSYHGPAASPHPKEGGRAFRLRNPQLQPKDISILRPGQDTALCKAGNGSITTEL